jgi:hypothetical protein
VISGNETSLIFWGIFKMYSKTRLKIKDSYINVWLLGRKILAKK